MHSIGSPTSTGLSNSSSPPWPCQAHAQFLGIRFFRPGAPFALRLPRSSGQSVLALDGRKFFLVLLVNILGCAQSSPGSRLVRTACSSLFTSWQYSRPRLLSFSKYAFND